MIRVLSILLIFFCPLNLLALQFQAPGAVQQIPPITFTSNGAVASVQMSGSATGTYGSEQQTGAATLQASANGLSSVKLQFTGGSRLETQNAFNETQRQCTWTSLDGTVHKSSSHQSWVDAIWFLPQITMQAGAGAPDDSVSVTTSVDGKIRFHHERHPANVADQQTAYLLAHLSAVDLFVDSVTGLPASMTFAAHPDDDAGIDLRVEIDYSGYNSFNGVTVPTHIQKFINNSLVLDIQISAVQVQFVSSAATPALTLQ